MDKEEWMKVLFVLLMVSVGCIYTLYEDGVADREEIERLNSVIDENKVFFYDIIGQANDTIDALDQSVKIFEWDARTLEHDKIVLEHELKTADIRFHTAYDIDMKPTYDEVLAFLEEDETDDGIWTVDHDCTQFAHEVMRSAVDAGMFACIVTMDIDTNHDDKVDAGHAIVAFDTLDAGVIYIEPQNDEVVYMHVGMNYWCAFTNGECGENIVVQYDSCFGMF